jgi:hypothetical protein
VFQEIKESIVATPFLVSPNYSKQFLTFSFAYCLLYVLVTKFDNLWLAPYKIEEVASLNTFYSSHLDG